MFQQEQEVISLVIAGTIMLLLLGIFIIGFLFFYQKKHNSYITEKAQIQSVFDQELLKAQIEIQEQTLTHISREIHDNIGQVLSFVKLSLASAKMMDEKNNHVKIDETRELISQAITDLRDLSKSLSYERIKLIGLPEAIKAEVDRVTKSGLLNTTFKITGEIYPLGTERELVLFRIFQEALNNTLKYAHARNLHITLNYTINLFNLDIQDDGKGFLVADKMKEHSGAGLKNMQNRAALIGGSAVINSDPGSGCNINILLHHIAQNNYADGIHQNSAG